MARKAKKQQRRRYTAKQRARILAAATKHELTAPQVEKRFGVKPVTFYLWRMNAKRARGGSRRRSSVRGVGFSSSVRAEVQKHVRAMLPEIVREETRRYLARVFD